MGDAFLTKPNATKVNGHLVGRGEVVNRVVHPVTQETITKYKNTQIADPILQETWVKVK